MSSPTVSNDDSQAGAENSYLNMDMLRFSTAGSVDDGKSTLIGRLLYDTKSIFEDQMEAIESASARRGEEYVDLALLTDGLRAEREQRITIDVAYRYFATPRRKFIIADTPGHVQYTRNMVTGASTAELAIILVDARNGVITQSKRHAFISTLLQIPHLVVAINKMDLVDYKEEAYEKIVAQFQEFAQKLDVDDVVFIPMSALKGDNIVNKGENMPWYNGPTLLHHLEHVNVGAGRNLIDFRFPVQYVIRPNWEYRGFAGRIASGTVRPGDEIVSLPSKQTSKIKSIDSPDSISLSEAFAGDSVVISLEDEIDVSRGDMIVRKNNLPNIGNVFEAYICWMHEQPMEANKPYVIMHTTKQALSHVSAITYRIDVDTLHREEANELKVNEIGLVEIVVAKPLAFDQYKNNHETGSFVLVDPASNVTVGAGMIRGASNTVLDSAGEREKVSKHVVWEPWNVPREQRTNRNGHDSAVVWFTGLSGSGKSSIAREVEKRLFARGTQTMLLDGDQVRHGLCGDLGFSDADRKENIRRVAEVARLFFEHGDVTICTFISPFAKDREFARKQIPDGKFIEVFVDCDIEECKRRDPKGLYKKAIEGQIPSFTGISSPYEPPTNAEIVIDTAKMNLDQSVDFVIAKLAELGLIHK
ncbi:sulfate adenylyltransferase subunit CysN [soil metagenome]